MKNNIVELTKEEYDYLQSLNLNLTSQEEIYFDYDFLIANIDKTPREIANMDDTFERRMLSWFDKLFANNLNEFFQDGYEEVFTDKKAPGNEKCPLNDKNSSEYKKYINYKKVFALSMKMMVEGKGKDIKDNFNGMGNISQANNESTKEFVSSANSLLDNEYSKPGEDYIGIDSKINIYKSVLKDRRKPKLSSTTSFEDIIGIVEKSTTKEKLTNKEAEIANYIAGVLSYSSISDALDPKGIYYVDNYVNLIFIVAALTDKKDYSDVYKSVISAKKSPEQEIEKVMPAAYKGLDIETAIKRVDSYINGLTVSNLYQEYSQYLFNNTENFNFLANPNNMSQDEIVEKNKKYFARKDHGKVVNYQVLDGEYIYEYSPKLTDDEINEDKKRISDCRNSLEDENASQEIIKDLIDIIDKKLSNRTLNDDDIAKLNSNGIDEQLSDDELKIKRNELEKNYEKLHDGAVARASKIKALVRAGDILGYKRKKSKNGANSTQNPDEPEKIHKSSALKKWAQKIPKVACPILGSAIGYNLAFVLGPVGIVATNAIGAFIITQARAYANILEEQELSAVEVEIESIEKPTNKVCNKVSNLLQKLSLKKLAKFNMFEKLSKTRFEKINKIFSNKEVLRTIANTVTVGLVALDFAALKRVISQKLAASQNSNTVNNQANSTGKTENNLASKTDNVGTNTTGTPNNATNNPTSNSYGDPDSASLKIGDTIGADGDITYGYRNSYDALYGKNAVKLNQAIMKDNSVASAVYYPNSQGIMENLNLEKGANIVEELEKRGYDISKAVINTTNKEGKARAFTKIA